MGIAVTATSLLPDCSRAAIPLDFNFAAMKGSAAAPLGGPHDTRDFSRE